MSHTFNALTVVLDPSGRRLAIGFTGERSVSTSKLDRDDDEDKQKSRLWNIYVSSCIHPYNYGEEGLRRSMDRWLTEA